MFEGLIASILNRFFSGYIDEIDYKNLQIGLISGSVELKNLSLRHDAFFQFDVPIEVRCSRVGRLHVRVPWRSIYAEPVVISIEDVYVLASPMSTKSMHDPEKMTQVSIAAKRKQVKALNRGITVDDERQVDRGFFKTLVDTVLNNIQIHVKNVHIRYEDSLSLNSVFLFAGVTLEQVLVTTTDADGKQIQLDSEAEFVFKVGKVNDFNVYFNAIRSSSGASSDCLLSCKQVSSADVIESLRNAIASSSMCGIQFENLLRRPLSVTATLRLNRFRQQESLMKPHITLDATLDVIDFSLSVDQFISMKALVDHYRIVLRNSHYVKYRPKISVQDSPREWWKYAYTSIVEERIRSYNWERIKLYRHQYRQYKKLYQQAIKSHEIQDGIANEMDTLEITLNLPTIMIARQHAKIECKKVSKDVVYNLTNEEKEELYRMIGFNEQVGSDDRALTELSAQLSLQSISFELRNSDTKLLIHAELNSISSNFAIQPMIKSGIFQIEFDSMAVAMDDGSGNHVSILRSIYSVDDKANLNKFMHLKFKKHSINSDSIADYDVSFGLLTVEFVYEYAAINNVLAALKSSAILEMITNAASQNLARLSNYSTAGLIYAIENHKRFMVNALIYSPIIVIPQGGTRGGPGIVTYLGKVELTSDLTPSNINDHSQLSKNMYDRFNLHLTNAQILMCDTNSEHIFDRIENDNKLCDKSDEWRILEPANLDAVLLLSIRPNCYSLPQLIIKSNINDIDFIVSDETMIALHKFIIDLPLPSISTPSVRESIQYEHDVFYDPSYDTLTNSLKAKENEKKLSLKQKVEISTPLPAETDDVWSNCFLGEESHYTELRENYTKYMLRFVMRKATIHVRESKNVPYLRLGMEGLNCDLAMTVFGVAGSISVGALRVFDVQQHVDILETLNDDLVTLRYRYISAACPSYTNVYQSLPHYGKIKFRNLCFVCRQEFMVKLIRFSTTIMKRMAKQTVAKSSLSRGKTHTRLPEPPKSLILSRFPSRKFSSLSLARVELEFGMFTCRIVCKDVDIAALLIQGLWIEVGLHDDASLYAKAALKDMAVRRPSNDTYSDIVNLLDDNLFDATIQYADKSLTLNANVGRIRIVFLYGFFVEVLNFVSLLSSVNADLTKSVLSQAKETVYRQLDDANAIINAGIKQDLKLNIHVNAPSIIVPRNNLSRHAFMIQMGTLEVTNETVVESCADGGKAQYLCFNLSLQSVQGSRVYMASDDTIEMRECILLPIGFTVNISLIQLSKCYPPNGRYIPIKIFSRLDLIRIEMSLPSAQLIFAVLDDNIFSESSRNPEKELNDMMASVEMESIDLASEDTAKSTSASEVVKKASTEIEFSLHLLGASVKIIETIAQTEASIGDVCLVTLSSSTVLLRTHVDDTLDAHVIIGPLSAKDVRADSNLAVQSVIEPVDKSTSNEDDWFFSAVIRLTADKDLIVTFKLEKLKINLCLPFLLYLERFIMNAFFYAEAGILFDTVSEGGKVIKLVDQNVIRTHHKFALKSKEDFDALTYGERVSEGATGIKSICINGNLELPDVAIFAQPTKSTSKIILLKSKCVLNYNQIQTPVFSSSCTLSIEKLSLSLIDHSETTLTILNPCNSTLKFEQDEDTRSDFYIDWTFSQVQINLTPSVYNTVIDVLSTISDTGIAKKDQLVEYEDRFEIKDPFSIRTLDRQQYEKLLEAHRNEKEKEKYPNLVEICREFQQIANDTCSASKRFPVERVRIRLKDIFLIYSEETQHELVPLMIALISIRADAHDWSRRLTVIAQFELECSYYNDALAVWEPFIEPLMIVEDRYRPWKFEFWFTSAEALSLMAKFKIVHDTYRRLFQPYINSITLGSGDKSENLSRPKALPPGITTSSFIKLCSDDTLSFNLTPVAMRLLYRLIRVITNTSDKAEQGRKELKPFLEVWNHTGLQVNIQLSKNVVLNPDVIHSCTITYFDETKRTEQHEKPQQSTIQSMTTALLSPLVSFPMVSMRSGITEDDISDDLRKYRFNIQFTNLSDIHDLSFKRSGTLIKPVVNQTYHCSYLIFITISREHSAESISLCPPTRIKNVTRVRLKLYCHRRDDFPDYLPFDFPESCFPNVFTLASLEPDEVFEVPVQVVYHCEMLLAPDDPRFEPVKVCNSFFELNPVDGKSYIFRSPGKQSHIDVMRFWPRGITATTGVTSLVPSMIESKFLSSSVTNMGFYFKIDTLEHETVSASVAQYRFPPRMIIVTPALTITNALPFDVKIGELWVKTGRTLNYHSNDTLNQVSAQFEYDNVTYDSNLSYDGYSYTLSVKFVSATKEDYPIYLNICQGKRKESALPQANALVISAPYWIHNRTGLDLEFKAHDYRGIIELPASVRQRIFGYPFNRKGRAKIRLMHCARWSQEFNIETIGVSLAVPVKDKNNRTFEISCKITFSNTGLTRIIQFLPTYTLVNRSGLNVQLKDPLPQMSEVIVRPNGSHPFWPNVNPIMSLRTHDDNQGSMPWTSFPLVHCMSTAIGLGSQGATVSVGVPPGTKVTLKKLSYGDAPVQLRNLCSDLSISISQSIVTESSDLLLRPFESIYYIFPNSALTRNLYWSPVSDENSQLQTLFGKPAKFLAVFDRDDAGQCPVLKPNNERTNIFWMSSYDDVQRVLTFTDNGTLYQILGQPDFATFDLSITLNALKVSLINDTYEFGLLSCQGSEARWHMKTKSDGGVVMKIPSSKASADWLEYKYRQTIIDDGSNNEERCNQYVFDFMDMSVKEPSEGILIRTNRPAIELSYRQSAVCIAARVVIWHSQLDNQLTDSYFDLVFYPMIESSEGQTPFIDTHLIISMKDNMYIIRSGKVSIKQFCLNVDKGFLCTALFWLENWQHHEEHLQSMTRSQSEMGLLAVPADERIFTAEDTDSSRLVALDVDLFFERAITDEGELTWFQDLRIVIESFSIDSVSLRMSFSLDSSSPHYEEDDAVMQRIFGTIGHALTIHIGKAISGFSDVPFSFKSFNIEHRSQNFPSLVRLFQNFYMLEAIKQAYVLVFGLNLLGNPYGLLKQFSDVVGRSLYDPLVQSVKSPKKAKTNLRHTWREIKDGTAATVSSAANSASLITDYAGRALASFSFDKSYKLIRYRRLRQQRVSDMPSALKSAGRIFLGGWARGFRDIIEKPVEERRQIPGKKGFGKGLYKGFIGLIVKPSGGIFDSASIVLSTLSRLTSPAKMITPTRLPRTINPDIGLQPYTEYGSKGASILRTVQVENGVDDNEFYWTHLCIANNMCVLVTDARIYLLKPSRNKLLQNWKIKSDPIDISSLRKVFYRSMLNSNENAFEVILERKMNRILAAGEQFIRPIKTEDDARWICSKLNTVIRLEVGKEDLLTPLKRQNVN